MRECPTARYFPFRQTNSKDQTAWGEMGQRKCELGPYCRAFHIVAFKGFKV